MGGDEPFPWAGGAHACWSPSCEVGCRGGLLPERELSAWPSRRALGLGLGLGLMAFGGSLVQMGMRCLMDLDLGLGLGLRDWLARGGSSVDLSRSGGELGRARRGLRLEVCAARSLLCWGVLVCGVVRQCLVLERAGLMRRFRCCKRLCWLVDRCLLVAEAELRAVLVCRMGKMAACACLGPLGLVGRSYRIVVEMEPLDVKVARAVAPC
jgi:hypothetical protein